MNVGTVTVESHRTRTSKSLLTKQPTHAKTSIAHRPQARPHIHRSSISKLRNPTSTPRQWLLVTDLLAVRIRHPHFALRSRFGGGGGPRAGAMAGRIQRHRLSTATTAAMATAITGVGRRVYGGSDFERKDGASPWQA